MIFLVVTYVFHDFTTNWTPVSSCIDFNSFFVCTRITKHSLDLFIPFIVYSSADFNLTELRRELLV